MTLCLLSQTEETRPYRVTIWVAMLKIFCVKTVKCGDVNSNVKIKKSYVVVSYNVWIHFLLIE